MSKEKKKVTLLAEEKEYMDALAERLCARHDWEICITNFIGESAEQADLIVAEVLWITELERRTDLLDKTIFLMEDEEEEEDPDPDGIFPRTVYKYDGFKEIEHKICEAMDAAGDESRITHKDLPKVLIAGAWEGGEEQFRDLVRELALKLDGTVLYMGMERFPKGGEEPTSDETQRTLEDLLYYALERTGICGCDPEDSLRTAMYFYNGICSLPDFLNMNPLSRLKKEEWDRFLPLVCSAARARAVVLWTGKEELTRCGGFYGLVKQCLYLRPERQDSDWKRFHRWLEEEGADVVCRDIRLADSWTEIYRGMMEFGETVVSAS